MQTGVLVIGAGPAGASAAISAHAHGATVTLVEKTAAAGGNCPFSGGNLLDVTGRDALVHLDAMSFGKTDASVFEAFLGGLHDLRRWLHELGASTVERPQSGTSPTLPQSWPHFPGVSGVSYYAVQTSGLSPGRALWAHLAGGLGALGLPVLTGYRGDRLIRGDDGAVVGAVVTSGQERVRIAARAVILATGGFENNLRMCDTYLPISPTLPVGHLGNTGDGVRMATEAGASLWHMSNFYGWAVFRAPEYPAGFPLDFFSPGHLFVDGDGLRFCDETGREVHDRARMFTDFLPTRSNRPQTPVYAVFDEGTRLAGPISRGLGSNHYRWSETNSEEITKGWIVGADDPAALAGALEIDPGSLARTVSAFDDAGRTGRDEHFHRAPDRMAPLEPPLCGIRMWPGVATTSGGPRRDFRARVLDADDKPIKGLFAAGNLGGIWGGLTQHGGGLGDALVFGRIAGYEAATHAG